MKIYHFFSLCWNYKVFFIYFSNLSQTKDIYEHKFVNKGMIVNVLYSKLKISCILHSVIVANYISEIIFNSGRYRKDLITLVEIFLIELMVYSFAVLIIYIYHLILFRRLSKIYKKEND